MLVSGAQSGLKPGFLLDGKLEARLSTPDCSQSSVQTRSHFEEGRIEKERGERPTREIVAISFRASQPSCVQVGSYSASLEWEDPDMSFPTVCSVKFSFEVDLSLVRIKFLYRQR